MKSSYESTPDLLNVEVMELIVASFLSRSISPEKMLLEPNSMRSHLSEYLTKGEFSLLNFNVKKIKEIKDLLALLDILCTCWKPFFEEVTEEDNENFMIVWSKCGEWYHKKCKKVPSQFFGNMMHVNDRWCFTFGIKCKLLLDFY